MLKRYTAKNESNVRDLVKRPPFEIIALLERGWNGQLNTNDSNIALGHPDNRSDVPGLPFEGSECREQARILAAPPAVTPTERLFVGLNGQRPLCGIRWDHLIYAYMIEQTRIYEIFRRVIQEFSFGEKLGTPSLDTQLWLRTTEELFYSNPAPFSITNVSSHIRPDLRATRRNLYQRMFGMELNHGTDDNAPYSYPRAEAANNEFVTTFEELLREVWVGQINRNTTSGANPTDDSKIEELAKKLHDMLTSRRQNGAISREEFFFVSMMSWFHMTVDNNLPVIEDMRAQGVSAEQRLFKIAQLVGLPAHGLSRSYFEIAEPLSALLIAIESGVLSESGAGRAFYDPTSPNQLAGVMNKIITHWSIITGHDIKAGKVAVR
jgi:hypothetical protein